MKEQDMIEKLRLTSQQKKAFNKLKRALSDFRSAGGVLVGSNDMQYAMNGYNFVDAHDYYSNNLESNYISVDEANLDYIEIADPFNDAAPYIEVRE